MSFDFILGYHGNLSSGNCVVDFRWICKITDFGLRECLSISHGQRSSETNKNAQKLLWRAPELLISSDLTKGTQAGDVYSFGVIFQEITLQDEPFALDRNDWSPEEIVARIKNGDHSMKPRLPASKYKSSHFHLIS